MSLIELTFGIAMFTSFVDALLDKWLVYRYLMKRASAGNSRFLYDLMSCRFCIMFHISWISCILPVVLIGFEYEYILVPMLASGLIKLIER